MTSIGWMPASCMSSSSRTSMMPPMPPSSLPAVSRPPRSWKVFTQRIQIAKFFFQLISSEVFHSVLNAPWALESGPAATSLGCISVSFTGMPARRHQSRLSSYTLIVGSQLVPFLIMRSMTPLSFSGIRRHLVGVHQGLLHRHTRAAPPVPVVLVHAHRRVPVGAVLDHEIDDPAQLLGVP